MNCLQQFRQTALAVGAVGAVTLAFPAFALTVTTPPTFGSFGTLAGATFGGTGIPNDAVAMTTVNGVTLGLTATQRYSNPALSNDGAGVFTATAGADSGDPGYAKWNFNYYIGGSYSDVSKLNYKLFYDKNPLAGTDLTSSRSFYGLFGSTQDSSNLGMGTLYPGAFNPSALGEYTFALVAYNGSTQVGLTSMAVNVVPEPEAYALALAGIGVVGMFGLRRKAR